MKLKRHSRRRMAALLLVTVLMLATTSLSYTLWSEELGIDGTVTTGTLDAQWLLHFNSDCDERHTDPDNPQLGIEEIIGDGEYLGKDVGSVTLARDPSDDQLLNLTINGAYPYYAVHCVLDYKNNGTVPWHIQGLSVVDTSANLTNCVFVPASPTSNNDVVMECDQLYVILVDGIKSQIHPGGLVGGKLFVQLKQPASEGATYTFTAAICVAQWNEDPDAGACFAAAPVH